MSAAGTELMLPALRRAFRRAADSFGSVRARPITGSHLFRIDGYKLVQMMVPSGSDVKSDTFRIAGLDWQVSYYPNGLRQRSQFVSVGLKATEGELCPTAVAAASVMSIVDRDGVSAFTRNIQSDVLTRPDYHDWEHRSRFAYRGDFVGKEELIKWVEHHMDDDRLHIRCDVVVLQTNTESRLGSYLKDFWR